MAELKKRSMDEQENDGFKLSEIWDIVVLNWQWIVLSTFVALGIAFAYLRYADKVYSHSMSVLIKEDKRPYSRNAAMSMETMGIISNSNGFENEIEILKSSSVNARVVKSLHLYTSYWVAGRVRKVGVYNKVSPIIVDMPEDQLEELKNTIKLEIQYNGKTYDVQVTYRMPEAKEDTKETHKLQSLPAEISTIFGTIIVQQNPNSELDKKTVYATITPINVAAKSYRNRLAIAPTSKLTTVATITMNDTQSQRALDYLNELFKSYNEDANEDKNEVAKKTEEFIKERIAYIRTELDATEIDLEQYKKTNELVDLTSTASTAITSTNEYQKKQVELQTQINLLDMLIDYVNNPANALQVIPANLGLSDANLNANIKEYNEHVTQRKRLLESSSESNPTVQRITAYLDAMWPSIKISLDAIRRDMGKQKESIDQQFKKFSNRISSAPTQERRLTNISRQQEIKANLYLLLLQKQEENYISLASTAAKARIVNEPQSFGKIKPRGAIVWLIALMLGIAFPIGIVYLRNLLRYNIEGRSDLEKLTKATILADIPLSQKKDVTDHALVVRENTNDMMEEAFRGLRTNLRFIMGPGEKVIASTSCIPGEGKTFISTNLAMSLALMGKRVILVGLDIRKPRLVKLFKLPNNKKGITSFLTNPEGGFAALDEQIAHGVGNQNLDILPAGIIPPNPSELISREQLDIAIDLLKEHYDYVVLDTPPIGLVSDTLSIGRVADMTLFVCRADYSPKSNIALINGLIEDEKLPKVNLVLNGVDLKRKKYGYYYGYGKYGKYSKYGYGKYGYGRYGHYGVYGKYGSENGQATTEK